MLKLYFILLLFPIAVISCREKYEITYQLPQTSYLVVEGVINTHGITQVKLSRTTLLSEKGISFENQASLTIEGEDNSLYPLSQAENGTYITDELLLDEDVRYRLKIKTKDDRQYVSSFVEPIKTPLIDSITWTRYNGGIEISVNARDAVNDTRYYKFEYEETWEFKSRFPSYIYTVLKNDPPGFDDVTYGVYDELNNTYNDSIFTCWQSQISTSIILGSTAKLGDNKLYMPIVQYPRGAWQLSFLYSINLKQQGISKEGYEFFQKMKKNTESLGSIFDGLPSEISGNVSCVTDTLEKVIGFVEASSLRTMRKFISVDELEDWEIEGSCGEQFMYLAPRILYDELYLQKKMPTRLAYQGLQIVGLVAAPRECVDCTLRGAHIRPSFWP